MMRHFQVRGLQFFVMLAFVAAVARGADAPASLHTFDGKYDIGTVHVTVVYYVPKDRTALPDWKERVDYYVRRVVAFHERELNGQSKLHIDVRLQPLVTEKTSAELRGDGDQNMIFHNTMNDVSALLKWSADRKDGFPILLVMSDINWRELDDFHRTRIVDGKPQHEGNVAGNGRHFPGAESGGARCAYFPDGHAFALVSADGWRVPYSGSDCVIYHEGVGHAIALPHPEPGDDSVMSRAQYNFWINQTWIDKPQKEKLGWKSPETAKDNAPDLFTAFTALPDPLVPPAGQPVALQCTWPKGAQLRSLTVRVQTELFGPWHSLPVETGTVPPARVNIGTFDRPTPVSYRVDAKLQDGQSVELWGYFQVKTAAK